jgi:hypothetical protein
MSWWLRVTNVFRFNRLDQDLDDEQRFHVEARAEELTTNENPVYLDTRLDWRAVAFVAAVGCLTPCCSGSRRRFARPRPGRPAPPLATGA